MSSSINPGKYNTILDDYCHRTGAAVAEKRTQMQPSVADIRVERIENGYLVVYGKMNAIAKRKYAKDLNEVGEVTKQACIELELTGVK